LERREKGLAPGVVQAFLGVDSRELGRTGYSAYSKLSSLFSYTGTAPRGPRSHPCILVAGLEGLSGLVRKMYVYNQ
jgi:hypothetical protein